MAVPFSWGRVPLLHCFVWQLFMFMNECYEYMRHISSKPMLVAGALATGADRCRPTVEQFAEALGQQVVILKFSLLVRLHGGMCCPRDPRH